MAKQVLFDGNKTATGVVVETGGFNYTLSANKEIILSAGAVSLKRQEIRSMSINLY
jgi:hypothetical protein